MKIVQSFWSRPYAPPGSDLMQVELSGGWPHRIVHYYSWAFSCLQLRKFYDCVELVTDDLGKEIFIDRIKLPYTKVDVGLNDLADCDVKSWALGKLYAYSLQKDPFLHIDGDIFIFNRFEEALERAPLAAQNFDEGYPGYSGRSGKIWEGLPYVPEYFKEVYEAGVADCCNMGVFGGTDIAFIQCFVKEALLFFENNKDYIFQSHRKIDPTLTNIIMEQGIYYYYARYHQREITYLYPGELNNPPDLGFFQEAPKNKHYVHCYGFYKGLRLSYSFLEWKLKTEYPWYYHRIRELVGASEI